MVFNWTRKVITEYKLGFRICRIIAIKNTLTWTFHNDGDPCCRWESQKQPYPLNQLIVDPHCTDEYLSPRDEQIKIANKRINMKSLLFYRDVYASFSSILFCFVLLWWWWYCRVICVKFFRTIKVTVREIEQARLWSTCKRFAMAMKKREWAIGDCEIDSNTLYRTCFWFVSFFRLQEKLECSRGSGK